MSKPHLVVSRVPLFGPWAVTCICGQVIGSPQYVPAFDSGELPSVTPGAFHPKCERAFAEMQTSGKQFIYAVTEKKEGIL